MLIIIIFIILQLGGEAFSQILVKIFGIIVYVSNEQSNVWNYYKR